MSGRKVYGLSGFSRKEGLNIEININKSSKTKTGRQGYDVKKSNKTNPSPRINELIVKQVYSDDEVYSEEEEEEKDDYEKSSRNRFLTKNIQKEFKQCMIRSEESIRHKKKINKNATNHVQEHVKTNNLKRKNNDIIFSSSTVALNKENKKPKFGSGPKESDLSAIQSKDENENYSAYGDGQSGRSNVIIDLSKDEDFDVVQEEKKVIEKKEKNYTNSLKVQKKLKRNGNDKAFPFSEDSQIVFLNRDNNYIFATVLSVNEEKKIAYVEYVDKDDEMRVELDFYEVKDPRTIFSVGRKIDVFHNNEWKNLVTEKVFEVQSKILSFDASDGGKFLLKDVELKNVRMSAQNSTRLKFENEEIVLCDFRESGNEAYDVGYNNPGKFYFVGKIININHEENMCDIRYFDGSDPTVEPGVNLNRLLRARYVLKVGENIETLGRTQWQKFYIRYEPKFDKNFLKVGSEKIFFENIRMNKAIYCAPRKKGKEEDDKTKNKTNEANKEAPIKKKKVLQQSYYDSLTDEEKVQIHKDVDLLKADHYSRVITDDPRENLYREQCSIQDLLEIKDSLIGEAGEGLFPRRNLPINFPFCLYAPGTRILTTKAEKEYKNCPECKIDKLKCEIHSLYMAIKGTQWTAVGQVGEYGVKINHDPVKMNAKVVMLFGGKYPEPVFVTCKPVAKGEELYLEYNGVLGDIINRMYKKEEEP